MKGIVFTEFLELVESNYGIEVVDDIIEASDLPSNGSYTTVGTYEFEELNQLVQHLSKYTNIPVTELLKTYGQYLFKYFANNHSVFFQEIKSTFQFLNSVENYIHVEVKKLYPDAELPSFVCNQPDDNNFVMVYRSTRPLASFAEGLILGCIHHFGETIQVSRQDLNDSESEAQFNLTKQA